MSMRVLIVDDEPLARDELAYLLGQCEGVSAIAQADSIEEALGEMLEDPVDLIFLDIHLTNESGLSLAGKINEEELMKPYPMVYKGVIEEKKELSDMLTQQKATKKKAEEKNLMKIGDF